MHTFKVGQMVDFMQPQAWVAPERGYKVLSLLRQAGGERRDCIKTIIEPFTRIADESELAFNISRRPKWHDQLGNLRLEGAISSR